MIAIQAITFSFSRENDEYFEFEIIKMINRL